MGNVPFHCGKEGDEVEDKGFGLSLDLCSNPHLWSLALSSDQKDEIANISS